MLNSGSCEEPAIVSDGRINVVVSVGTAGCDEYNAIAARSSWADKLSSGSSNDTAPARQCLPTCNDRGRPTLPKPGRPVGAHKVVGRDLTVLLAQWSYVVHVRKSIGWLKGWRKLVCYTMHTIQHHMKQYLFGDHWRCAVIWVTGQLGKKNRTTGRQHYRLGLRVSVRFRNR